jgi:malonyl-CoA O-methyltransferase
MIDKSFVKENFSRCAKVYDQYASIQVKVASLLISVLEKRLFTNILEIGCGTGIFTLLLKAKLKKGGCFVAVDLSEKMIQVAKRKVGNKVKFIVGDGERIGFRRRYDLVASNAVFQWFENLEGALSLYRELLRKGGWILFSVFGPKTFFELAYSLKKETKKTIPAEAFIGSERLTAVMKRNFKEVEMREEILREEYPSLMDLLRKIRYTGEGGGCIRRIFPLSTIQRMEKSYMDRFGKIEVTYQVFLFRGIK